MHKEPLCLTSMQNPRIKEAIALRNKSDRDAKGLFLIEGYRELLRAQEAGWRIQRLFICPTLFLGTNEEKLIDKLRSQNAEVLFCSEPVFRKISYRDRPDGLVAIAQQRQQQLKDLKLRETPFIVIAEAIEKPGNLGTILRSADAVGVDAVIICDRCTDIYNPNVVRASVGTLFTIPVIETSTKDAVVWLKEKGIAILAATPQASNEFTQVNLSVPLAIAVGTEQLGLSQTWMEQADIQVRIPMYGVADSLNVAMATTLLLYEASRQRHDSV